MQDQQVPITADQNIRLGCQRQREELVVFGIAAGAYRFHQFRILDCEDVDSSANGGDKCLAFFPIEVAVEFAAVEHCLNLSQRLRTRANIANGKRSQQRLMRY